MKKIAIKALLFLPLLLVIVGTNYFVDPLNHYSYGRYEKNMANYLLQKKYVTDVFNYDEREFQKDFLQGYSVEPSTLILGSSKNFLLDSSFFSNQARTLNCSVSGATIEDEIGLFGIAWEKGWRPGKVIIGIEPYFFNANLGRNYYGPIKDFYYRMCSRMKFPVRKDHELFFKYGDYRDLVSWDYFQRSLLYWFGTGNQHTLTPTMTMYNKNKTRCPDGTIIYPKDVREASQEEVDDIAQTMAEGDVLYFSNGYDKLSPVLQKKFEAFIDFIQKQNIKIEFVIAPYHPIVFAKVKGDPKYSSLLEAEKYIRGMAMTRNIKISGDLDPQYCGIDHSGFYDGQHLKKEALVKVFQVREDPPESIPSLQYSFSQRTLR